MKVKMLITLTGSHPNADGVNEGYPPAGGEIVVDDRQGAHLVDAGYAVPVVDKDADVEVRDEPVKRGPGRPRKTVDKE